MKMKKILALTMTGALASACWPAVGTATAQAALLRTPTAPAPVSSNSGDDSAAGTAGGTFKLGVIGPLTGGAAIYGTAVANAAQIAVDEINALGGDIQFELKAEDDVNDAETSVNAYNTLMDWGMQILVGTVTTTPALAVVPLRL